MKIVFSAGGTGGHIYPALTLAKYLKDKGHKILFIGSNSRMEKDVIPNEGFEFIGLDMAIPKGNVFKKFISLISLFNAYIKCKKLVKGYDCAIGFGNYISLPVIFAARKLGLKTIIHEQNSFAGKANLLLDEKVDYVIGSYDSNTSQFKNKNTFIYGNPQSYKAKLEKIDTNCIAELGLDPTKKTVLMFMGSQGSESVNKILDDFFIKSDGSYQIIYACGKQNLEMMKNNKYGNHIKVLESVDGTKFIKNCDLVVARAGATTVCELIACGSASILIPSPFVPENHQFYNAKVLSDVGGALLLEEKNLNSNILDSTIKGIINNDESLNKMKESAFSLYKDNTLENIVKVILK